ncbi:MAG: cytochrome C biogenesis protein [bacterium]|nr:cytochrome C biogenesis protein [bacterium]
MDWINANFNSILQGNFIIAVIVSYLAGVLTSTTPCVYPLVPVTVSIIGSQKTRSRMHGFMLAFSYVGGIAVVYSILGIMAAVSGIFFGQISTHPLSYLAIGLFCLFFSLWMFGLINISRIGFNINYKLKDKASFISVFLMGAASGFAAAPCTAPVLSMLLTYVAVTGSIVKGGVLLFVFAYGLGTLLILLGSFVSLVNIMPKPGVWMTRIKFLLALVMLFSSGYFFIKMVLSII